MKKYFIPWAIVFILFGFAAVALADYGDPFYVIGNTESIGDCNELSDSNCVSGRHIRYVLKEAILSLALDYAFSTDRTVTGPDTTDPGCFNATYTQDDYELCAWAHAFINEMDWREVADLVHADNQGIDWVRADPDCVDFGGAFTWVQIRTNLEPAIVWLADVRYGSGVPSAP